MPFNYEDKCFSTALDNQQSTHPLTGMHHSKHEHVTKAPTCCKAV